MPEQDLLPEDVTTAQLNTLFARWSSQGVFDETITIDSYTSFEGRLPREIRPRDVEDL